MWKVEISKQSEKFLEKISPEVKDNVFSKVRNVKDWLENKENLSVDLKKLKGEYDSSYRIRSGKIRIIIAIDRKNYLIRIQNINFRGSIY